MLQPAPSSLSSDLQVTTQRSPGLLIAAGLALAYGLTALAGAWAAYDRPGAAVRLGLIALGLATMLGLAWSGRRWGDAVLGPAALACAALAAALGAYYLLGAGWQAEAGAKLPALQGVGAWIQAQRPAVALPEDIHPNVAGGLLAILLPLGAGGAAWAWTRGRRIVALAAATLVGLGGIALVLTLSRGAWLGLAAALATSLWLIVAPRAGRSTIGKALLALALLAALASPIVFALVDVPLADRLVGSLSVGPVTIGRPALWRDALALIGDYPFTGSGLGSTAMVYSSYALLLHVPYLYHMHSLLLQLAVEQGIAGAALFAALLAGAAWAALSHGRTKSRPGPAGAASEVLAVAALASLVALAVHGAVDSGVYVSKGVSLLYVPLGMALAQAPLRFRPTPWLGLALAAAAALLLLPANQAAFQANLGAVSQTRAELAAFHWPQVPIQDVLRRPGGVDLAPAQGRFAAALALDPANVTANRRLGQIALANQDHATARRYLETAYDAAPGQRATRQMLGELAALAGDPTGAAALWQGLNLGSGQLEAREWWYTHLGQPQAAAALRQAAALIRR